MVKRGNKSSAYNNVERLFRLAGGVFDQGVALFVALVAAELNSLVLNPLVTNLMFDRNNVEFLQAAKVGQVFP